MNTFERTTLALALATVLPVADAQTSSGDAEPARLEPVVVVANKAPRPLNDVVGTVSLITATDLANDMVHGIDELVRYEPGIVFEGGGNRFGVQGFNIRGIGGNRVALEIDGIPLADQFDIGNFSNASRDPVDVAILERVEILRGPASTLYGSDAIGGVVAYITRDPEDLVRTAGQPYFSARTEYAGVDAGLGANATAAAVSGAWGALASLTYRRGDELDRAAGSELDTNDYDSLTAFLKLTYDTPAANRLALTVDHFQRDDQTEIRSILGTGRFRSTTALRGDDTTQRDRFSLDYQFQGPAGWLDSGRLLAYHQDTQTDQSTLEDRAGRGFRRDRDFHYRQETSGLELNLHRDFAWGSTQHRFGYGLDISSTRTTEQRDTLQVDLETGESTNVVLGEVFPVRDFPISRTREIGLYIQDEINWPGSRWTVIPAVRFDHYELDPRADALYREDFPDTEIVAVSESDFSPKLGFLYQASDTVSLFGQYAHGFRAPPFEDVNIGLDIPMFNIRAIPNPELKSESSDGLELGVRYLNGGTSMSLTAFHTDYQDFIETKVNLGPDPDTGVLLFQSQNIAEAHIYGAELRVTQDLGAWNDALSAFQFQAGLSWTEGENDQTGQPINSLQPGEAVLGLGWSSESLPLNASLMATFVEAKSDVDETQAELFQPGGYGVIDLIARYRPIRQLNIRAGVFNLTDKTYWRWSEVQGLGPSDPLVPNLSAPGRHTAISFSYEW